MSTSILHLLPLAIRAAQIGRLDIPLPRRRNILLFASRPHNSLLKSTKRKTPPTRFQPAPLLLNLRALALIVRALPTSHLRVFILFLPLRFRFFFRSHGGHFGREPVDRPPQAAADDAEDGEVDAVSRDEQQREHDLQQREGDVGGYQEGWRGAGDEDGLPQVGEEVGHDCWGSDLS